MDQKIKIIVIILGVFCLLALLAAFSYVNKYKTLSRDYIELEKKNYNLQQQNKASLEREGNAKEELSRLKEREAAVRQDLERLASKHDDLQKKFEALSEERNKLIERLQKTLAGRAVLPAAPISAAPSSAVPSADEYWAGVLKGKENLELQLADLKNTLGTNQLKMNELSQAQASLELEVNNLSKEKTDLQRQLGYNEKMADSLSLQLVREKDDKRNIEKQENLLKEENYALRSRLKEVMSNKVGLEKKLKDTEDKRTELYNRLNQMDGLLQEKLSSVLDTERDYKDIGKGPAPASEATVELPAIVVSGGSTTLTTSPEQGRRTGGGLSANAQETTQTPGGQLSGKVLSINEENNFVILDIGENQGIRKGQVLHIYQAQALIATLEVVEVRANVSAADIKEKTAEIKTGDVAR